MTRDITQLRAELTVLNATAETLKRAAQEAQYTMHNQYLLDDPAKRCAEYRKAELAWFEALDRVAACERELQTALDERRDGLDGAVA